MEAKTKPGDFQQKLIPIYTLKMLAVMKMRLLILAGLLFTLIAANALGQAPTITNISPTSGPVGSLVTVTGTNFNNLTALSIAGVTAIEISNDGTTLVGFVMPGATSGTVDVTTVGGSVSSSQSFTVNIPTANPALQLGADIDGQAAGDESGSSVSLSADGKRLAVGAPGNDGTDTDAGQVRIYEWSGSAWGQVGLDIDGEAAFDQSGWSVSLSADGQRVAIGAIGNNGFTGHVRVYEDIAGVWTKIGDDIDGESAGDQSGYSVSLSADGQRVAIGARLNDGAGANAGNVRIYQDNAGVWTQIGIDIDGEAASDQSAFSVSLSANGQRVAIGAPFNAGNGSRSGHVRIFENIGGTWTQVGADINGEAINEEYGWSVSFSADGQRLAIGATAVLTGSAGYVRIYEWSGAVWNKVADIDGETADDRSGISVSLSADGQRVAIGARLNSGGGTDAGHVRIYEDLSGTWTQVVDDIDGEAADNESGRSVSLSANGKRVAIGAPYNNGNGISAGHVRAFQLINPINLTNSNPVGNTNSIAANANITLTFDADVNLLSVNNNSANANEVYDDNIKIFGSQSGQLQGVYNLDADNSIVIFDPTIDFKAGEKITVTVTNNVLGILGEVAVRESFSFITATGPYQGRFKENTSAGVLGIVYGGSDWGDYDNDGDLDLAVVGFDPDYTQIAIIYDNDNGIFTDIGAPLIGLSDAVCKWGDFDGDGDLDLAVAGIDFSGSPVRRANIYQNNGGVFTDINAGLVGVDYAALDWGDYDNDGDLDLVVSGRFQFSPDIYSTTIYENNGGTFTDIGAGLPAIYNGSVDWGDYDADGDLDLLLTGEDVASNRYFEIYNNDGGIFTNIGASLPGYTFSGADWGDYDNDGDLDIAVIGTTSVANSAFDGAFIFQNNAGTFTDIGAGLPDEISEGSIQWGDYNGDGFLDIVLTGQDYSPGDNIRTDIFENNGGIFTNINAGLEGAAFQSVGNWGDYDGDGDLDLFVAGDGISTIINSFIYENTIPAFTLISTPSPNATNILTTSNITLDFAIDVDLSSVHNGTTAATAVFDDNITVLGNQSGQIEGTYSVGGDNSIIVFDPTNDFKAGEKITVIVTAAVLGTGGEDAAPISFSFIAASGPFEGAFIETNSGILGTAQGSFDWGDYDNDGDLDVIVVGFDADYNNNQAAIYRNDNGTFTDIGAGLSGVYFSAVEWGDYDNDGDLDLVIAGADPSNTRVTTIYQNNGGIFTDIGAGLQGVDYAAVDWGDFDNDGDLDLVVTGRYSFSPDLASTTVYENNGGVFTDISAGLQALNNGSADWGDYDGDGDLDLLVTGFDADWAVRYAIIYNNNDGVFTDHVAGLPGVGFSDAEWGDYDNDGDLDILLLGDGSTLTYTSIFNNEGGVFTDIGAGLPTTSEGSVKWGDFDGDGNLDLVITGQDYSTSTQITNIYRNNGSGSFTDINARLQTVNFQGLADFIDYDGDGDLDLFAAGEISQSPFTSATLYENTTFPVFYSQGSGAFDTPALWNSTADGSGFNPIATNFTNGKTDFVIQNAHTISPAAAAISMNNFTIEDGGIYENGDQDVTINGATSVAGTFSDAVTLGENYFLGTLSVEPTGSFTTSGAISNTFRFYDDITNRGTFNLTSSVFWHIEADLIILNESSSDMSFSGLNSGIGSISANLIIADSPGGGNILLRSNDYIRMADNTTLRNELGDYPTNSRILELAELRTISGSANFENAENAITLVREGSAGTYDGISFDFTANNNLIRYFSNGNVQPVDHYHMAVTAGATSLLLGPINILGNLTIENSNTLDANGHDINIAGDWINANGVSGFVAGSAAVNFNGSGINPQVLTGATNFNNLVIDNTGNSAEVTVNSDITISSALSFTSGILSVTDGNTLSLLPAASVNGTFGANQMIQLAPVAAIRKYFDADGSFTFPIGTSNIYNESILTLNTGTIYNGLAGSRYIELSLTATEEPNVLLPNLALTKYWSINSVNLSNISGDLSLRYDDLDAQNGDENNYLASSYDGNWTTTSSVNAATNTFSFAFAGATELNANYTAGEPAAFIPIPTVSSFSPTEAANGDVVTIIGTNFSTTNAISFGGTEANSFTIVSDNEVTAVVGSGSSGNILITTLDGSVSSPGFTFIPAPTISAFTPTSAAQGETVSIVGTNFTDASEVRFGSTAATSTILVSSTEITATVGAGSSGDVTVTTAGGTATSAGFEFIPSPVIGSFSPTVASIGDTVTIIGTNFSNVIQVTFGGTITNFITVSDTEIRATVGDGTSGVVVVTTPGGSFGLGGFIFASPQLALFDGSGNPITNNQTNVLNLGATLQGFSLTRQFTLENPGTANLSISSIVSSDAAFQVLNVPDLIEPLSSATFSLQFSASDLGSYSSEIVINNNTSDLPEFTFTVDAELTRLNIIDNDTDSIIISNQAINLGSTFINVDIDKVFNIENVSANSIIEILSITVENPVFQIINIPTSIAPSSSAQFTLRLIANEIGDYSGTVTVVTNLNESSFQVTGEVLPENNTDIKVFNVVTPNGDGRHDFLEIENITEYVNNRVSIFNRWGNQVFEITGYDNDSRIFIGISDNGEELLTGNYYYVIDKGNGDKRISGFLLLKR